MYQVVKRDGKIVDFNINKISAAITKAFEALEKAVSSVGDRSDRAACNL